MLCHEFRKNPDRGFFVPPSKGPTPAPKSSPARALVIALRKQNRSVYEIARALAEAGTPLSAAAVAKILRAEGFAKLPRRRDDERPLTTRPSAAAVADVRQLDLSPRSLRTRFGGLFLFLPDLVREGLDKILDEARFPGTKMIPAAAAMRSLLGLKLHDGARHSHVMSSVFDEGLALFAGLNAIPKRSFLTAYSCRIAPGCYPKLMARWFDAMTDLQMERGESFDCDLHTIPFHGADALMEKHYVSKRSRRQKGILAFVAQDADSRVFCYANGEVRKADQNDELMHFVQFWKTRTGRLPAEVGLRFQADHLCQPQQAQRNGHCLHYPAPALARYGGRHRPAATFSVAPRRARECRARVQDPTGDRREDRARRLHGPDSPAHHR